MIRTLDRDRPLGHLRIWTPPDWPAPGPAAGIAVEWTGRAGHPTSYALLGGSSGARRISLAVSGPFADAKPGDADTVEYGLPAEYRCDALHGLTVTVAAHGKIGSDVTAFERVARFLRNLLRDGIPADDGDVWERWDAT
jgi:hypothetical protein